jgi:hypothetical protein
VDERRMGRSCLRTGTIFSTRIQVSPNISYPRSYAHPLGRSLRQSVERAEAGSRASSPTPVSAKGGSSLPTIVGSPNVDAARKMPPPRNPVGRSEPGADVSKRNALLNTPVKTKRVVHKRTLELENDRGEEAVVGGGPKGKGGSKGGAVAPVIKRDQVTTVTK